MGWGVFFFFLAKNGGFGVDVGPIIRFLQDKIKDLGGDLHQGNIRCLKCDPSQMGGGFHPQYGILLCANRTQPFEDTLAHGEACFL